MSKLKLVNAHQLETFLLSLGFIKLRTKVSHSFYKHEDGRYTTIAFHSASNLPRPIIRSILRQIRVDIVQYNQHFQG
jgi:predicted RNA binding protein YcfA (HicA-like mRNA interferase family)